MNVQNKTKDILQMIYENEKISEVLADASKEMHIINQWMYLTKKVPFMNEHEYILLYHLVKRGAIAPNAQTGCERANSVYNLFKTKLSVAMKLPMIKARLRIKTN